MLYGLCKENKLLALCYNFNTSSHIDPKERQSERLLGYTSALKLSPHPFFFIVSLLLTAFIL